MRKRTGEPLDIPVLDKRENDDFQARKGRGVSKISHCLACIIIGADVLAHPLSKN